MIPNSTQQPPSINLGDIYYILFRHKWKILLCTLAGLGGAAYMYKKDVPPFQSQAKLLVRYIVTPNKSAGPAGNNAETRVMTDERGERIMATEKEILQSSNLANEVAEAVGPEKILAKAGGGKEKALAAAFVRTNLSVVVPQASSVISLTFRHPDSDLAPVILSEIITRYLKLHLEMHRGTGQIGESLTAEADTLRVRLGQTEDELRKLMSEAGVSLSIEHTKTAQANQITATNREIFSYETELAGKLAIFEDIKKRAPVASTPNKPAADLDLPPSVIDEYRNLSGRLIRQQTMEQELSMQFTAENARVKQSQVAVAETEAAIRKMRDQYPGLTRVISATAVNKGAEMDASEASNAWIQITAYQAKIKALNDQLEKLRFGAAKLDQVEGRISALQRRRDLEETNYRYYQATLEAAKINDAIGAGKVSNISPIETPTSAFREAINLKKIGLCAASGILAGLAWAFLIELYFDRSVRRPIDLVRTLRAPLFLSIPNLKADKAVLALNAPSAAANDGATSGNAEKSSSALVSTVASPGSRNVALQPFHETLRDRLIGYFESQNLTHKPKLVAVTGLSHSSGVTTTAAGLARSLSETGEGNVLLVDMTVGQGAATQFNKGKEACGLDELLEARSQAHVEQNLYVVTENSNSDRLSRNLPQRFTRLIPKLKASDFDYIIFDMPVVNQLSITPRLAGFMDMVLLVVESEKSDRDLVSGACSLLAESKAHVGVVLNKTRNYVPGRLNQELMAI